VIRRFAEYFAIAWLSLPVTLLAQGAPGSIQGIVCEVKTCKPIDGVQVWLVHSGNEVPVKTMRTDASGEFGFFDLQPGTYMVKAGADNFITHSGAPSAVITNGERIENVKLELTALGTISGTVFDENSEPVAGARVEVLARGSARATFEFPLRCSGPNGGRPPGESPRTTKATFGSPVSMHMSITSASFRGTIERMERSIRLRGNPVLLKTGVANTNGDFTINAIRPGNYTLLAFPDEDEFTPAFLRDRDLLEKYEAFGQPVSIGAGQTIRADVTVVPEPRR
jgi:hypothetical protein